jgi:tetratricopeptide (TPR) repeat protein
VGESELLLASEGAVHWQYVNVCLTPFETFSSYLSKAEKCADRIFELNPDSYHGYFLKGVINWQRGNPKEAIRYFKKAVEIDSNKTEGLMGLGSMYASAGKMAEARSLLFKAAEVDPLNPISQDQPGWIYLFEGDFTAGKERRISYFPQTSGRDSTDSRNLCCTTRKTY